MMAEASWPAAAQPVRVAFMETDDYKNRPYAPPRFILAQDGKIVLSAVGNSGWRERMWPRIAEITGTA